MNDVNRLRILQDVMDQRLTIRLAVCRLGISVRNCRRLLERYREHGPLSLVHRRCGQPGNRQLIPGLYLAKETVRKLMTQVGLWFSHKLRPPRVHQPRPRRACTGEIIVIDGDEHSWFEDRGPACTLFVYVDDATAG